MFIGQVDNSNYEYARINVKAFRRGGKLVRGFTRKLKQAGVHKEAVVAGSGMLGAKVGFFVGGPPGSLAGEFVLSNSSRKAIGDASALKQAVKNLKSAGDLGDLSKLERLKLLHKESAKVLKQRIEARREEIVGDIGGFLGGSLVGSQVPVPFAGLALGPAGATAAQKLSKRMRFRRRSIPYTP